MVHDSALAETAKAFCVAAFHKEAILKLLASEIEASDRIRCAFFETCPLRFDLRMFRAGPCRRGRFISPSAIYRSGNSDRIFSRSSCRRKFSAIAKTRIHNRAETDKRHLQQAIGIKPVRNRQLVRLCRVRFDLEAASRSGKSRPGRHKIIQRTRALAPGFGLVDALHGLARSKTVHPKQEPGERGSPSDAMPERRMVSPRRDRNPRSFIRNFFDGS